MRFLIVDDDAITRMKLKALIKEYGTSDEAENGYEAVEMIKKEYADGKPFNVCTLDIEMPVWDGLETLRQIRTWEQKKKLMKPKGLRLS